VRLSVHSENRVLSQGEGGVVAVVDDVDVIFTLKVNSTVKSQKSWRIEGAGQQRRGAQGDSVGIVLGTIGEGAKASGTDGAEGIARGSKSKITRANREALRVVASSVGIAAVGLTAGIGNALDIDGMVIVGTVAAISSSISTVTLTTGNSGRRTISVTAASTIKH